MAQVIEQLFLNKEQQIILNYINERNQQEQQLLFHACVTTDTITQIMLTACISYLLVHTEVV